MPTIETQIAAYLLGQAMIQPSDSFANFGVIHRTSLERQMFYARSPWTEGQFRALSAMIPADGIAEAVKLGLHGTAAGTDENGNDAVRIYVSPEGEDFINQTLLPNANFIQGGNFKIVPVKGGSVLFTAATGGDSVSPDPGVETGTLGGWLKTAPSRTPVGISNNHVLAECDSRPLGNGIIQPGSAAGGRSSNAVGKLRGTVPLKVHNPLQRMATTNHADLAWAEVNSGTTCSYAIGSAPGVSGEADLVAAYNDPLRTSDVKIWFQGWKSGKSTGKVVGVSALLFLVENSQTYYFEDQIELDVTTIQRGDSGSLVLTDSTNMVGGLVFAKRQNGTTAAFANPWQAVRNASGLNFVYP